MMNVAADYCTCADCDSCNCNHELLNKSFKQLAGKESNSVTNLINSMNKLKCLKYQNTNDTNFKQLEQILSDINKKSDKHVLGYKSCLIIFSLHVCLIIVGYIIKFLCMPRLILSCKIFSLKTQIFLFTLFMFMTTFAQFEYIQLYGLFKYFDPFYDLIKAKGNLVIE